MTSKPDPPDSKKADSDGLRRRRVSWWKTSLVALTAGVLLDAYWLERRRLQVSQHEVLLLHLPFDLDGLRIVQLTDLHLGRYVKPEDVRRKVEVAVSLRPDIMVLTGDFVEYHFNHLEAGLDEIITLKPRYGIYASLGNHDHWEGAQRVIDALETRDIRVLVNENTEAAPGLWLAGVDDLMAGMPDLEKTFENLPDHRATVLLSHNPKILPRVAHRPVLVLSGHTHGGQIGLPFLPPRKLMAIPGMRRLMDWYEGAGARAQGASDEGIGTSQYIEGWYEEGEAMLYVCRGIGMGSPFRISCPPEIALFILRTTREPEKECRRILRDRPLLLTPPEPAARSPVDTPHFLGYTGIKGTG